MRKWLFLIIAMTTNLLVMPANATKHIEGQNLKILSWNIYMLPYLSLFNSNGQRAARIAQTLNESDYQIIVFQEAFSSKCRNIMAKALADQFPYQYGPANKTRRPFQTNSGLWVVSRIPLTELSQIQFSVSRGYDAIARKGAVLFEGSYSGSDFQLLATHLQADSVSELRRRQCSEIREHLLDTYYRENVPQFICGDFNIDMDDTHNYRQMLQTLDAENGDLSGSVKVTYDEIDNHLAYVPNGKKRVIDYVLVRNSKLIHNIERKVQTFFTNIGGIRSDLSDHYAMEFCVEFSTKASDAGGLVSAR